MMTGLPVSRTGEEPIPCYILHFMYLFPEREQFNAKLMRKKTRALHNFACILKLWCYTINSILIDMHFPVIAKLKCFDTSSNKIWDYLGKDFCSPWSPDFHHTEVVEKCAYIIFIVLAINNRKILIILQYMKIIVIFAAFSLSGRA